MLDERSVERRAAGDRRAPRCFPDETSGRRMLQRLLTDVRARTAAREEPPAPERYTGGDEARRDRPADGHRRRRARGGYVGGGMSSFFSDMLGDRALGVAV